MNRRSLTRLVFVGLTIGAACAPRRPSATRVARALDVTTGDRAIDADLARVRAMQVTMNESEREYLEIMAALARALSPTQDADLAALSSAVRRSADELHSRGKALVLELDVAGAEAVVTHGDARTGCDQFAQPANVHRCQSELSRVVRVVFHERVVVRPQEAEEDPSEVDVDPRALPASSESFATATATAVAELAALRIRLGAVAEMADPLRERLQGASPPARFTAELRDAIEFLRGVAARARVERRQATTAAESLANSAQRAAR